MRGNDRIDDSQTKTGTARFAVPAVIKPLERLEDRFPVGLGNTGAIIADGYLNQFAIFAYNDNDT